jgi:hypothetical protein
MTITETCRCGAKLEYSTPSSSDMHQTIDMFHNQHKQCTEGGSND